MSCLNILTWHDHLMTQVSEGSMQNNPDKDFYALIYGMSALGMLIMQVVRGIVYNHVVVRAASKLHNNLFVKVRPTSSSLFLYASMAALAL